MGSGSLSPYLLMVFLIFGSIYCAGTETAFSAANKIRIRNQAENGEPGAKKALYILRNFDKALAVILILNNTMSLSCAALATMIAVRAFGMWAVPYATVVITITIFFLGEMLPKSIAKAHADKLSVRLAGSLYFLMRILTPVAFVFTKISAFLLTVFVSKKEPTVTEDELYDIIETMTEEGGLESEQGELIQSALEFDETTAQDILTSRVDLVALDAELSPSEVLAVIRANKVSRIPVYRDTIDNIVGILQIRKFLKIYMKQGGEIDFLGLLDPPHYVHKKTKIDDLLKDLSRHKTHMAVVADDYGGTLGIVTVEDILEELVGEIWDEDDIVVEEIVKIGENRYEVNGRVLVQDAFDQMDYDNYNKEKLQHKTMSAWVLERFESWPAVGDSFDYRDITVFIEQIEGRRIVKLVIERHDMPLVSDAGAGVAE